MNYVGKFLAAGRPYVGKLLATDSRRWHPYQSPDEEQILLRAAEAGAFADVNVFYRDGQLIRWAEGGADRLDARVTELLGHPYVAPGGWPLDFLWAVADSQGTRS